MKEYSGTKTKLPQALGARIFRHIPNHIIHMVSLWENNCESSLVSLIHIKTDLDPHNRVYMCLPGSRDSVPGGGVELPPSKFLEFQASKAANLCNLVGFNP